jgi:oligoribonuclease NrnB/cAMP/cGMP phosphodiesterase (DHH superfamily)
VLISILSVNLTVFSQTDINNQQTKCFSIPTVRKITKDLLSGDSAKEQLGLVNLQLFETEKKSIFKDSVISLLRVKEENYNTIISNQNEKISVMERYNQKLKSDLKKERTKNLVTKIISGGIFTSLTFLLISR